MPSLDPSPVTINERALNAAIRHAVFLERLKISEVKRLLSLLEELDASLTEKIGRRIDRLGPVSRQQWGRGLVTTERAVQLRETIRAFATDARNLIEREFVASTLVEVSTTEGDFSARRLQSILPIEWDVVTPGVDQLRAAARSAVIRGTPVEDWVSEWSEKRRRAVERRIRLGFIEGETTDDIVRGVLGRAAQNYRDGALAPSRRGVEALVRTSINHVATEAREMTYGENADLVSGVQWVSTLDSRTTPICRALDGKVFKVGEGRRPPAHANCRSTTVPVLKSWKELGIDAEEIAPSTRASMNGQVAEAETYQSWLAKQPTEFQNEVLGETKGILFRKGGLPLDRFVDLQSGREFTITELRRREMEAFKKAGLD